MKRVYVIVPTVLMIAVATYVRFRPKQVSVLSPTGDSPFSWPRPPVKSGPAVQISPAEEYQGRDAEREAHDAIQNGKPRYFAFGPTPAWHEEFAEIWKQRFAVAVQLVTAPIVSDVQTNYYSAYNRVVHEHIKRVHGWDALDAANRDAKTLFEDRRRKKG